jgi:hypothetical protein
MNIALKASSDANSTEVASARPSESEPRSQNRASTTPFDNGYQFPPSLGFWRATRRSSIALWNFTLTPIGLFTVIYSLLVVAWGGMLFLLLCNAAPAMCHPTCNDINSPRRKWIEYDSQVVNALFCVPAFGLAPWRFRDLYFLMRYRILSDHEALRRLAGINRNWFRLHGSQSLPKDLSPTNVSHLHANLDLTGLPFPEKKIPDPPLTGRRAPPTKIWKLDLIIWAFIGNTVMQCLLCGFMWGMNRYNRPSFAVGLFVGLGMVLAALGGLVAYFEGKSVKAVEGVPLTEEDRFILEHDKEQGIPHYNNIKDKKPKTKGMGRLITADNP